MHCRCAYTGSVPSGYMRGLCDFGVMSRTKRRLSLADTSRNDTQRSNTTYRRTSHGLNLAGDLQHRRAELPGGLRSLLSVLRRDEILNAPPFRYETDAASPRRHRTGQDDRQRVPSRYPHPIACPIARHESEYSMSKANETSTHTMGQPPISQSENEGPHPAHPKTREYRTTIVAAILRHCRRRRNQIEHPQNHGGTQGRK